MSLEKALARMRKARRSVTPDAMHKLLTRAGFVRRQAKGSHWIYTHERLTHQVTIVPGGKHLLPSYVSKALNAIEEALEASERKRVDGEDEDQDES